MLTQMDEREFPIWLANLLTQMGYFFHLSEQVQSPSEKSTKIQKNSGKKLKGCESGATRQAQS